MNPNQNQQQNVSLQPQGASAPQANTVLPEQNANTVQAVPAQPAHPQYSALSHGVERGVIASAEASPQGKVEDFVEVKGAVEPQVHPEVAAFDVKVVRDHSLPQDAKDVGLSESIPSGLPVYGNFPSDIGDAEKLAKTGKPKDANRWRGILSFKVLTRIAKLNLNQV